MPTLGNPAASTALPQPPNTSQNVPKTSAITRRESNMVSQASPIFAEAESASGNRDAWPYPRRDAGTKLASIAMSSAGSTGFVM